MQGAPTGGSADGFMGATQFGYNSQTGPSCLASRLMSVARALISSRKWARSLNFPQRAGLDGTLRRGAGVPRLTNGCLWHGRLAYSSGDEARPGFASTAPRTGFTVGGGVEYALASSGRSALKYSCDFGKSAQSGRTSRNRRLRLMTITRRSCAAGLNYRFGWDGLQK